MKAIELEETSMNQFLRTIFDYGSKGYVKQGVVIVGFVAGRVVTASYFDTLTFTMLHPDATGLASLYDRLSKALKKFDPNAKILNDVKLSTHSDEGINIQFSD